MTLLNPLALLFALSIGLIVWLHFRRPKRIQYISNLHLWQKARTESDDRRPILQRIRKNRRLIMQILFLSFVILALARPELLFWNKSRTVVFIIDCSASMNAREHGGTRMELARRKALKLIDSVGSSDRVLIVQGRPQPTLNYYSGSDKGSLRQALENLSATEASADIGQAMIMGLSSIQKDEFYEAFIFSDGTQSISLPRSNDRVHYIQIGESENNAAITRFSIRNNPFSPHDREIYAEIANFSDQANKFRLEISIEKAGSIDRAIELDRGQRKSFAVKAPPGARGIAKASIDVKDDLDSDNRATVNLDLKKTAVLLVASGNQYLEKALRVNPCVACTTKKPEECTQEELKKFDVIIMDGVASQMLPPSNYLLIDHPTGSAITTGKNLVSPMPHHPVMSFVNINNVIIEEAIPLKIRSSETVLIEEKGKPLMTASETGPFRMVRMGFDIRSSNLPLTLSFPVLISNIVNWLGARTDESASPSKEQESNIKPVFKPQNRDASFSEKPVLARTGWEIYRALLFISLALLMLEFIFCNP
jgi:Ca-activated chloride channel homolog